jgi:hypothetical protein
MTVEERFERIEHITAAMVEQFRGEREENRRLWVVRSGMFIHYNE